MNQDCKFDTLLKQGLLLAAAEEADALRQDEAAAFSPKYQKFREELLKNPFRCAKRKKQPVWKKALQIAACLLLVCAIGFGAVMVISPAARAGIMRWIRTVGEIGVSYNFYAEPMNRVPPRYDIGALPEGYVETERHEMVKRAGVFYQSEDRPRIYFGYLYMEEGIGLGIGTKGAELSDVEVNGCAGHFYYSPDGSESNSLVWMDEEAGLLFSIDMWAEKDEILRLAESVYLAE